MATKQKTHTFIISIATEFFIVYFTYFFLIFLWVGFGEGG